MHFRVVAAVSEADFIVNIIPTITSASVPRRPPTQRQKKLYASRRQNQIKLDFRQRWYALEALQTLMEPSQFLMYPG